MEERVNKLREERIAREKARIEKLREINLKKYNKNETPVTNSNPPGNLNKLVKSTSVSQIKPNPKNVRNNFQVNNTTKRPITAPVAKKLDYTNIKPKVITKDFTKAKESTDKSNNHVAKAMDKGPEAKIAVVPSKSDSKLVVSKTAEVSAKISDTKIGDVLKDIGVHKKDDQTGNASNRLANEKRVLTEMKVGKELQNSKIKPPSNVNGRKSVAFPIKAFNKPNVARKSMLPKLPENSKCESVFERLYKPKMVAKKQVDVVEKLQTDPKFYNKVVKDSELIFRKRHSCIDNTVGKSNMLPRRSISAVHFKRIRKSEINNCIHKWASIGEDMNKSGLNVNEDEGIKEDKVVSAIKSERKKVTFMTPLSFNLNTPRPEELQARLKSWLQKRGKNLDSYHHLQCFGIHHMKGDSGNPKKYVKTNLFDEENKENIEMESDSDDGSYTDNMNGGKKVQRSDKIDIENWRRASVDSESVGFNESANLNETTLTTTDSLAHVDELVTGALNDLTALLREGFDWQQSARWLRSIRERFPHAPKTAAYWECRAALEDQRGDLPASVQCWEEAIAKGTEHSVAESNLDQLLDKFMLLKISPKSGASREPDPKLVDVKNVFKSTIIRFAVQQAKLRRQSETPVFTVTPVRRSARLSHCRLSSTPLRLCDSVRQAATFAPQHVFTPNDNLVHTP